MFHQPAELGEALAILGRGGCVPLSGGTDVFPALVDRPPVPLLDLSRIAGLRGVTRSETDVVFGAATTWTDIIRADLPPAFDALKQAAAQVGSIQIQNRATVGGNLCNASPAADGVPPLLALDAAVELASAHGKRVLPLGDFLRGNRSTARAPDELLVAIRVPRDIETASSAFTKLGARKYLVISIVMIAAIVDVQDGLIRRARVAVGAASAVARRLRALEDRLVGCAAAMDFTGMISTDDLADLSPIDDVRATAAYRLEAARTLIARTLRQAVDA